MEYKIDEKKTINKIHKIERDFNYVKKALDIINTEQKKFREGTTIKDLEPMEIDKLASALYNMKDGIKTEQTIFAALEKTQPVIMDIDFI